LSVGLATTLFKIDARDVTPWPRAERLKIEGLDLKASHRVRVFCDAKPHQTFTFRLSTFHLNELCLFINDFYQTAQLWRPAEARWCKCKERVRLLRAACSRQRAVG
jgi:hypothetical protein